MIMVFSDSEYKKVMNIFDDIDIREHHDIVLIDARRDNKPSASNAKV